MDGTRIDQQGDDETGRTAGKRAGGPVRRSAADILPYLTPDLRATLASLHEAPESIATATVQLLPFGSRAALETLSPPLARPGRLDDGHGRRNLVLTPFCYEVMAAAAAAEEREFEIEHGWEERAQRAAAMIRRHPRT